MWSGHKEEGRTAGEEHMNIADKMEMESRLMQGLAEWMGKHGRVLSDRTRRNAFTAVRIREISWRGRDYRIIEVDGMACSIEHI